MEKDEAIKIIDEHKNKLVNPVEILTWVWFRVIILNMDDEAWHEAVIKAHETLSQ